MKSFHRPIQKGIFKINVKRRGMVNVEIDKENWIEEEEGETKSLEIKDYSKNVKLESSRLQKILLIIMILWMKSFLMLYCQARYKYRF